MLKSPKGQVIELFRSSSDLGWLKVQAVTDEATVLEMLKEYKRDQNMGTPHLAMIDAPPPTSLACPMDPTAVRTVNMGKLKPLTGVEFLRRRHVRRRWYRNPARLCSLSMMAHESHDDRSNFDGRMMQLADVVAPEVEGVAG